MTVGPFNLGDGVVFAAFWTLVGVGLLRGSLLRALERRKRDEWLVDGINLAVQGALVPFLQGALAAQLLARALPAWAHGVQVPFWAAFLLVFFGVDYAYYWNHRTLHRKALWPLHQVHHSVERMDVLATSRNTVWTSFLIVYLWLDGLLLFLVRDPTPIVLAVGVTAALDLWRHSAQQPRGRLASFLGGFLVLPDDHAWHHCEEVTDVNFGANLNLWDRLHGTWIRPGAAPERLGSALSMSPVRQLLWPWP